MSATRRRNLHFERDVTRQAARGYADPERLITHAEARSIVLAGEYVTDAMQVRLDQPRIPHTREEICDGRNHLAWWIEDNLEHPDAAHALRALTYLTLAYAELQGI